MHENAKKILKKINASNGGIGLVDLAKLFQADARKLLASKGNKRSTEAVATQASSIARNHLRTLVSQGYVKRVGRGEYTATAKKVTAKKATAKKATAKKATAKKAKRAPAKKAKKATAKKATAKKAKKAPAKKAKRAPAKKAKRAPAKKVKKAGAKKVKKAGAKKGAAGLRAELTKIKQQLRQLTTRVKKLGSSL